MKRFHTLCLALLLGSLLTAPAFSAVAGESADMALAADGTVWTLRTGTWDELFNGGQKVGNDGLVLALEHVKGEGIVERWVVPDTETPEGEFSPSLIYEESTETLFLIWESLLPNAYSRLLLTSFHDGLWSEVIEVAGNRFSRKGSPQLLVTRNADPKGEGEAWTVIHLTWWEESAIGKSKRYAPVVLVDGAYVGWTPIQDLGFFLPETDDWLEPPEAVEEALTLQRGSDGSTVVVGFLDAHSGRLASVEIQSLPPELAQLAEDIRTALIDFYAEDPTLDAEALAAKARGHIIHIGHKFHEATLRFLSEEIAAMIIAEGDDLSAESVSVLASKARGHIIHIGARVKAGGLESDTPWQLVEIGQTVLGGGPYQLLKVAAIGRWEAPEIEAEAIHFFVSESAHSALVAWEAENRVLYRETLADDEWSDVQQVALGETVDRDAAFEMLMSRVKNR